MPEFDIPERVRSLRPYVPGKPVEELQREFGLTDVIKLASNESPLGPSPAALTSIRECAPLVSFYPEGAAPLLRDSVAEHLDIGADSLVFGNGSDEVLLLLTTALIAGPEHAVVLGDPSFAMYEIYGTVSGATLLKVPLADHVHDLCAMADAVDGSTRIVFVANPNNPTGTLVTQAQIERFLGRVPDSATVVFDEAYYEFVEPEVRPDTLRYVREGRNVVVTRTFSKAYALAGLRVGYAIAPPELAAFMNRIRSPFNVNSLAQAAARAALGDADHLRRSVELNARGRRRLQAGAEAMGLPCVPSQANFVLIDVSPTGRDGREVFDSLLRRGIIVRPCSAFGLPNHIRVSVGDDEQIERFLDALAIEARS